MTEFIVLDYYLERSQFLEINSKSNCRAKCHIFSLSLGVMY